MSKTLSNLQTELPEFEIRRRLKISKTLKKIHASGAREETYKKIGLSKIGKQRPDMKGDKNWNWKGNNVGNIALHDWVSRNLGFAKDWECVYCGSDENLTWANISHKYERDLNDWMPLCKKCHFVYDKQNLRERDWHGRLI